MTGWPANRLSSRRIAAAVVLGLTFCMIRSFLIPLIRAAVFAIANWPLYRRCAQHVPEAMRAHVLPLAFSILITFLVLGPIVFAFAILARQSQAWLTELSIMDKSGLLAPSWLRATPMVGTRLADAWKGVAGNTGR